jgi:hypothetical protein
MAFRKVQLAIGRGGRCTSHLQLRWQACSSDKPHQRLLQPTVTPENRNQHPLRYRKQLVRASGRFKLAIGGGNGVYTVQQARLQACIREHAGPSVDEVMSLLARFWMGSSGQSAPWLSLGTGVSSPLEHQNLGSISSGIFIFLSNECLR